MIAIPTRHGLVSLPRRAGFGLLIPLLAAIFSLAGLSGAHADLWVHGRVQYWDPELGEYRPARNTLVEIEGDWYWRSDPQTHTSEWGFYSKTIERPAWFYREVAGYDNWDDVNIEAYAETEDLLDIKEAWVAFYSYSVESHERDNVPIDGDLEINLFIGGPDNNATDPTRSVDEVRNAFVMHQEIYDFIQDLKRLGVPDDTFDEKDVIVPAAGDTSYYNHLTGNINIVNGGLAGLGDWRNFPLDNHRYLGQRVRGGGPRQREYNEFKFTMRHEYSHAVHDELTGWIPPVGLSMPTRHRPEVSSNEWVAFSEGFADFLTLSSLELPNDWDPSRTVWQKSLSAIPFETPTASGYDMEGQVTGLLWDIFRRHASEEYVELPTTTANNGQTIPENIRLLMTWTTDFTRDPANLGLRRILRHVDDYDGAAPVDTIEEFLELDARRYPHDLHELKAAAYHRRIRGRVLPAERPAVFSQHLQVQRSGGSDATHFDLRGVVHEPDAEDRPECRIEVHHVEADGHVNAFVLSRRLTGGNCTWRGERGQVHVEFDLVRGSGEFVEAATIAPGDKLWIVLTDEMLPQVYCLEIPGEDHTVTVVQNETTGAWNAPEVRPNIEISAAIVSALQLTFPDDPTSASGISDDRSGHLRPWQGRGTSDDTEMAPEVIANQRLVVNRFRDTKREIAGLLRKRDGQDEQLQRLAKGVAVKVLGQQLPEKAGRSRASVADWIAQRAGSQPVLSQEKGQFLSAAAAFVKNSDGEYKKIASQLAERQKSLDRTLEEIDRTFPEGSLREDAHRFVRDIQAEIARVTGPESWQASIVPLAASIDRLRADRPALGTAVQVVVRKKSASGRLQPAAGAAVLLRKDGESFTDAMRAVADPQGQVSFHPTGEGSFIALARLPGHRPAGERIVFDGRQRQRVELELIGDGPATTNAPPATKRREPEPTGPNPAPAAAGGNVAAPSSPSHAPVSNVNVATTVTPKGKPGGQVVGTFDRPSREPSISGPMEVRGHVVVRAYGRSGQYAAVEGARLEWLDGAGRLRGRAVSGGGGRFSAHLIPGQYSVRVSAPQRYQDRSLSMVVRPGMAPSRIELARAPMRTRPTGSLSAPSSAPRQQPASTAKRNANVTVRVVSVAGGEFGNLPLPVSGVRVTATSGGRIAATASTGRTGYTTLALPPGRTYELRTHHAAFRPETKRVMVNGNTAATIQLTRPPSRQPSRPGEPTKPTVSGPILVKGGSGTRAPQLRLEVRVSNAGGEFGRVPLSGAAVTISQKGRKVAAGRTNSAGVYVATVTPGSSYQVSVSRSGYRSASKTVSVSANTRTDVVLQHSTHTGRRSPSRAAKRDPRADPRGKAKDTAHRKTTSKPVTVPF